MSIRRVLTRHLNPRYAYLPAPPDGAPFRILDIGAGPEDGCIAKALFPAVHVEAVNIATIEHARGDAFDVYHQRDLNVDDLSFLPDGSFDYVISSHTIEHLEDGPRTVAQMCPKVRPGGRIYLEWPSVESENFPIKGLGLNFYDDGTHVRTYPLANIEAMLTAEGFRIEYAGKRRIWLRILLSPLLIIRRSVKLRRLVLYDAWDISGFCYVIRAVRRAET
jgi:SAM-dependent methyltransferase